MPRRPVVLHGSRLVFEPGAFVELRESGHPGAVAEVLFRNRPVNGPFDDGSYHLSLGDVEVRITFTWDATAVGDDRIGVDVGAAFSVSDPSLAVAEGADALIYVFPAVS